MLRDDLLKQAADVTYSALRQWQLEPTEERRLTLLNTCRHYIASGVKVNLRPDAVIVRRLDA